MSKKAIIAGATGLVGKKLLELLLEDEAYVEVIVISRKPVSHNHPKFSNIVVDFDKLEDTKKDLIADDVFCCLGTTMKKAGSKEAFKKVDFHYPLELAKLTKDNGAKKYLLISALGADEKSSVFYNKVKGEIENAISELAFDAFYIFRPALLMGPRKEQRAAEDIFKAIFKVVDYLLVGPLKKYRSIHRDIVPRAMNQLAHSDMKGKQIHESLEMQVY